MIINTLQVSMFSTNCYLVGCSDTLEGVIIDPGAEGKRILGEIKKLRLSIKAIINTHGHVDHVGANGKLKEALQVPILLHRNDIDIYQRPGFGLGAVTGKQPKPDRFIREGDTIDCGNLKLMVLDTPGHTGGSVSLYLKGAVFTGDTLFAGSIGRTDLAEGSFNTIMRSIRGRLMLLPAQTAVYPGHGPVSTIGEEARTNPFINR
ncbi:MAG: MBL fold metallo-hydrolase [Bacillota bacterium]